MHNVIHIVDDSKGPFLPRAETGERCGICAYFNERFEQHGECRRHAPAPPRIGGTSFIWPILSADEWCGDFARFIEKGGGK